MKKLTLFEPASALLILLFTYTSVSKILDYRKFVFQMKLAPLPLMKWAAPILGWLVPALEVGLVILLSYCLLKATKRMSGVYISMLLLLVFEVYIAGMLVSGSRLPCTCGGLVSGMGWITHLIFNAAFIVLCVAVVVKEKHTRHEINASGE